MENVRGTLPIIRALRPRDPAESHRAASPLELLTDLCFVVAIAQAAAEFHHHISDHHAVEGLTGFMLAFFAIFLTWLNFTWFGSAYDNDDVVYRLLTILQIVGSLVIAAGIPDMFEGKLLLGVTGYVIMRIALVAQWLRAAYHDPERRRTCLRYAVGIVIVQLCWIALIPISAAAPAALVPLFVLFVIFELIVPWFAERAGQTPWHPHHIAERYGLFFIIVLGETVLSTTLAIQGALVDDQLWTSAVMIVVGSGVLIVFSVWWLYFSRSAAPTLRREGRADQNFEMVWGFGHYFIFGAAAAVGAGLAARVDYWSGSEHHGSALTTGLAVTVPVAVLLIMIWLIHLRHHDASVRTWGPFFGASALILAGTATPMPELVAGIVLAVLVAVEIRVARLYPA
ncbi:low temperature requirement protein A [Microlunatus speluncae]|uniref:low temperature requirement protein A n=1 Tax=Microlunatus speluncae TaxID=2594267 RepID=UPI001FE646D9|nr:low temperature requirement protein A [Microlunatus speluncae]